MQVFSILISISSFVLLLGGGSQLFSLEWSVSMAICILLGLVGIVVGPVMYKLAKEKEKAELQALEASKRRIQEEFKRKQAEEQYRKKREEQEKQDQAHLAELQAEFENLSFEPSTNRKIDIHPQTLSTLPPIHTTNITRNTAFSTSRDFVAFDVETTGLTASVNEIIEIAAIRFRHGEPSACFRSFVKPKKGLNAKAQAVNGITNEQVDNAPFFEEIAGSFLDFIGKDNLVAHNIEFDLKFLYTHGFPIFSPGRKFYDTLSLSRKAFHDFVSYKLDFLTDSLGLYHDQKHSALGDAFACGYLFRLIYESINSPDGYISSFDL